MKYKINSIFFSIQGEGNQTGMPAVFVRFAGCNLSCNFCDTDHSQKMELTSEEILEEIEKFPTCKNIILTGGEPTEQNLFPLLYLLETLWYDVSIESNGTNPIDPYVEAGLIQWVTISPKMESTIYDNSKVNEVKYIEGHFDPCSGVSFLDVPFFYIQPCDGSEGSVERSCQFVKENPRWRLSIQMHKLIGIQ